MEEEGMRENRGGRMEEEGERRDGEVRKNIEEGEERKENRGERVEEEGERRDGEVRKN